MPRQPDQPPQPDEAPGQRGAAGYRSAAHGESAADQSALADHPAPSSRQDVRQRLAHLPEWHPSSPAWDARGQPERTVRTHEARRVDGRGEPAADRSPEAGTGRHRRDQPADGPRPRPEPLTDAEHVGRVRDIRDRLGWARDRRLATDQQHLADRTRGIWTRDRRDTHDAVVSDLYQAASDVPAERKAIMAGGLGGAGKSTVLDKHAGIDRSRYLTINPDSIKEEMARRGLVPDPGGLSPMEASDLAHEESSHIAKLLAGRAMKDGKNIIWDITMSSTPSTGQRLDDLDRAGYKTTGIFVDISIGEAVRRADARHREAHEDYRAGIGSGGRYVPPEVIEAQADPEWGSRNRCTFEQMKPKFADWAVYDNSVHGRAPELIEASHRKREEER